MTRQRIDRRAAIGVHVNAREALADEVVGDDVALRVHRRAGAVNRGRALGIPAGALLARVLHAHRAASGLGHDGGIHRRVVGVAAAVAAWADHPDRAHLLQRDADRARNAVLHEVRLLRAGPAGDVAVVVDLNQGTGRSHAGMRLERPFVLGLDHARGAAERLLDVAGLLGIDLALAHWRLADVFEELRLLHER